MIDAISPSKVVHSGLNSLGHPVGHITDSIASTGQVVAEYTSDEDSFKKPFKKLKGDCSHARTTQPGATTIYLVSSRECGPKARNHLTRLVNVLYKKRGITVEIYDCLRLAQYIVDHLLLNDQVADRLEPLLGPLAVVRTQYTASNLVPVEKAGYRARPRIRAAVEAQLAQSNVVAICGISGAGKSELAAETARAAKDNFDCILWCRAANITSVEELAAVHIERRGKSANLRSMVEAGRCLLVLDDLNSRMAKEDLVSICGAGSRILITRQVGDTVDFKIPLLQRPEAAELLNSGMTSRCPAHLFERIWATVGGHPLALRLIRSSAHAASWEDAETDCIEIGEIPDEDRTRRLADRLLQRLAAPLAKSIALFQWCRAHRIDRSWARFCLGKMVSTRLDEYCLLAADRPDVLRLHDIFANVILAESCPKELSSSFEKTLIEYIKGKDDSPLNRVPNHSSEILSRVREYVMLAHAKPPQHTTIMIRCTRAISSGRTFRMN